LAEYFANFVSGQVKADEISRTSIYFWWDHSPGLILAIKIVSWLPFYKCYPVLELRIRFLSLSVCIFCPLLPHNLSLYLSPHPCLSFSLSISLYLCLCHLLSFSFQCYTSFVLDEWWTV
jgi:hypothetical protein